MIDNTRLIEYFSLDFIYTESIKTHMVFLSEIGAGRNNIEQNIPYLREKYRLTRTQLNHTLAELVRLRSFVVFVIDSINCYAVHPDGPIITDEMIAAAQVKKDKFQAYIKRAQASLDRDYSVREVAA